jgi:hypothetical protein
MGIDHEWARIFTNFHEWGGEANGEWGVMGVGCFSRNAAQWDSPGQRPGKGKVFLLSPEGAELRVLRPFRAWDIFYY